MQSNKQGVHQQYSSQQSGEGQYLRDSDGYQQMARPPVAGFSNMYMSQQNSNQSLHDHIQQQQYYQQQMLHQQQQQQQQQNENNGAMFHGAGFTDIPTLSHPSTPPPQNQYMKMANPQQLQQHIIDVPPPAITGLYRHNNNSNSLVQNNNSTGMKGVQQPLPQGAFSPGQYSVDSDHSQPNQNANFSNPNLAGSNGSRASSPFHQPQNMYTDVVAQQSPTRSINSFQQQQQQAQFVAEQQPVQHSPIRTKSAQPPTDANSNYMYFERRPDLLTKSTQDKAAAVKLKIENFYQQSVKYAIERNERRVELESELSSHDWSDERKSRQLTSLGKKESQFLRLRRTRLSLEDFQTIKVIGKGAFGEVRLVQKRDTGKIYAMKTLLKSEMYKKDQLAHVKAERDVLAGSDSPWVVSLYYSFQDAQYLYLIMEFLPGGDLMTMLIRWQLFTEDVTRFYMAECILAIETIHKLGFIHRDIKPDNILIDIRGHVKLSDFGLSTGFHKTHDSNYYKKLLQEEEVNGANPAQGNGNTLGLTKPGQIGDRQTMIVDSINLTMSNRRQIQTWRKSRRLMAYSTVGTPDYIAPEIFLYQGYGQECDWWSLGAIMYECLIGWPPFCSETPQETYRKIMNFEQTLQFPDDIHISYEAEDLIRRLLTHSDQRLGRHGGADEIKSHPFFRGVEWNTIRQVEAPYIPKLSSITDTRFFPTDELENVPDSPAMAQAAQQREQMMKLNGAAQNAGAPIKEDLPFIGYTYSRFDYLTRKNAL
ncbi:serine/threonine protein kinase CBK1 KNAG_0F01440 [Huiozyma naganishii CBS 8797]|uniref:Serine/threonine-protein kinase CBK1 n=1 Tax=Huiozyma naganishii (strain ATCC MYA-139 / BCRC 22969 / CBS 8797 / KCTC 17520 / NBRC 10181 / NCYC 3082 / Yp74L-3) TaxID=1071383 RepID=J7RZX9_HUIN7|nr:hypothetical protein KNAG_0F01440 [Kazachstania naganishii CBS 8797]CCK70812.1 hypothetical protein KNAG_0F01440 [Kazachstania naganishii CBS 8797]